MPEQLHAPSLIADASAVRSHEKRWLRTDLKLSGVLGADPCRAGAGRNVTFTILQRWLVTLLSL